MYKALIILSKYDSNTLDNYSKALDIKFSKRKNPPILKIKQNEITITFTDFEFYVVLNANASVKAESVEIAEKFGAKLGDKAQLANSACRLEVSSGPDVDMSYFNDFITIVESAESLGKVWAFDPDSGEFM
ncbi:hypothetical protein [Zooshikella ganghwensis]|uniref:Uncharacterized protein n=1 Tax=Zooshikella ganghwensis TaxID=202772 RepID=A0A4P9VHI1_9GAMM|nr:hypothetical protein [Zooshikella ganghwensis]RDH41834.1 hypothetical protein B9G39_26795 [Zooshikella ganghwensis]RDH41865.1 hypothetical protein B9G39_25935 [Zooshikella ganghwensis]